MLLKSTVYFNWPRVSLPAIRLSICLTTKLCGGVTSMVATELLQHDMVLPWSRQLEG